LDRTGHTRDIGKFLGTKDEQMFLANGRETNAFAKYYMFSSGFQYLKKWMESPNLSGCFLPFLAKEYLRKAREYELRSGYERLTRQSGIAWPRSSKPDRKVCKHG
jgi:hypothetical protein